MSGEGWRAAGVTAFHAGGLVNRFFVASVKENNCQTSIFSW
jgi:hypothetical protein